MTVIIEILVNVTTHCGRTSSGYSNGICSNSLFQFPSLIATDPSGNHYIKEGRVGSTRIRKISSSGKTILTMVSITCLLGIVTTHFSSSIDSKGIAVSSGGILYFSDYSQCVVRKIVAGKSFRIYPIL